MNAKKCMPLVLCSLLSFRAEAQAIDLEQEKKDNHLGGTALVCAAIGMVEWEEVRPQTKEQVALRKYLVAVAGAGALAYGSADVFAWKSTAATSDLKDSLAKLKISNYGIYANRRAELSKTKQDCTQIFVTIDLVK